MPSGALFLQKSRGGAQSCRVNCCKSRIIAEFCKVFFGGFGVVRRRVVDRSTTRSIFFAFILVIMNLYKRKKCCMIGIGVKLTQHDTVFITKENHQERIQYYD